MIDYGNARRTDWFDHSFSIADIAVLFLTGAMMARFRADSRTAKAPFTLSPNRHTGQLYKWRRF